MTKYEENLIALRYIYKTDI